MEMFLFLFLFLQHLFLFKISNTQNYDRKTYIFCAFCVFFLKNELGKGMQKALTGFAAGVMIAASIWSLLLPAIEQGASLGVWRFIPAAIGFWIGILFLMAIDYFAPPECIEGEQKDNLLLAVTLHNIPEGMAVGVIYAGLLNHADHITAMGAFSLALGIAIQNFPEGAIISMPLCTKGMSKRKAFIYGVLSGAVEQVASLFTVWAASLVVPVLPYFLRLNTIANIKMPIFVVSPTDIFGTSSSTTT